jgi:hypothetical protein
MSFYFLTEFFKYFFRVKICTRISKTPCITDDINVMVDSNFMCTCIILKSFEGFHPSEMELDLPTIYITSYICTVSKLSSHLSDIHRYRFCVELSVSSRSIPSVAGAEDFWSESEKAPVFNFSIIKFTTSPAVSHCSARNGSIHPEAKNFNQATSAETY